MMGAVFFVLLLGAVAVLPVFGLMKLVYELGVLARSDIGIGRRILLKSL
jgi:hypothetical protein